MNILYNTENTALWAAVHGVMKSQTWLSDFTFIFHFHTLEKEMAPHSSTLAWRIPGTGEPGGLPSMGSHRVGHDWSDLAAAAAGGTSGKESTCQCRRCKRYGFSPWVGKIPWGKKWHPTTPLLLPGKFHGPRSLVGYVNCGCNSVFV